MSTIPILRLNPDQIGIPEFSAYIEQASSGSMGADPFTVERHLEHIYVAISYVHEYFDCRGRRPSLFDLAILDGDAVADRIAPDLDHEGKAGIAHSITLLVDHARRLLDEITVTAEEILANTPTGWSVSTCCDQVDLDPGRDGGSSRPRRMRITIDLSPGSGPDDGASGGDPTVTPR